MQQQQLTLLEESMKSRKEIELIKRIKQDTLNRQF